MTHSHTNKNKQTLCPKRCASGSTTAPPSFIMPYFELGLGPSIGRSGQPNPGWTAHYPYIFSLYPLCPCSVRKRAAKAAAKPVYEKKRTPQRTARSKGTNRTVQALGLPFKSAPPLIPSSPIRVRRKTLNPSRPGASSSRSSRVLPVGSLAVPMEFWGNRSTPLPSTYFGFLTHCSRLVTAGSTD